MSPYPAVGSSAFHPSFGSNDHVRYSEQTLRTSQPLCRNKIVTYCCKILFLWVAMWPASLQLLAVLTWASLFCVLYGIVVPYSVGSAALQKLSDQRGVQMFAPGSKELLKGLSPIAAPPHAALNSLTTTASTESTVVLHGNTISSRKKKRCQITRTSQLAGDSLPPRALPGLRLPDDAGCREGGQVAIFSWDGDPAHHTTGALRQAEILKILKRFFPRRLPNPPLCLRIHKMDQACLLGKTFYEHLSYHSLAKGIPACCNPALKPIILPHVSVG